MLSVINVCREHISVRAFFFSCILYNTFSLRLLITEKLFIVSMYLYTSSINQSVFSQENENICAETFALKLQTAQ